MSGYDSLLLPGVLPFGKILAFGSFGSFGSPGIYHLCAGHSPRSRLAHTGPCDSHLCVCRRGHSSRVVDQYTCRHFPVGRVRFFGIDLLPGPNYCAVLCGGPVPPAN